MIKNDTFFSMSMIIYKIIFTATLKPLTTIKNPQRVSKKRKNKSQKNHKKPFDNE